MKVVLYHSDCQDGLFAALTVWEQYGSSAVYIPVSYTLPQNRTPEETIEYVFSDSRYNSIIDSYGNSDIRISEITPDKYKDIELIVVDFSFPVEHFKYHTSIFKSVLVLDHHHTAINSYQEAFSWDTSPTEDWVCFFPTDNSEVIFALSESGALLTRKYFYRYQEIPNYIQYVSDRDLWTFRLANTKFFHYGIKLLNENNFASLHKVVTEQLHLLLDNGEMYGKDIQNRVDKVRNSGLTEIIVYIDEVEYKCGIVNSYLDIASDLCNSILQDEEYSIAIAYHIGKDSDVSFSVRSISEVDSSVISKKYHGGGHKQASGFHAIIDELVHILTTKQIEV